jgi:hypothetical protein
MTGSGLGTLTSGAMPGVSDANLYGAPAESARLASVRAFGDRLARVRAFAAQLAGTRGGALPAPVGAVPITGAPFVPTPTGGPGVAGTQAAAAPAAVPWWQTAAMAVGGWLAGRQQAAPGVESIFDEPGVSPSGVVSIF